MDIEQALNGDPVDILHELTAITYALLSTAAMFAAVMLSRHPLVTGTAYDFCISGPLRFYPLF